MLLFYYLMRSNHWHIEEKKKAGFPIGCNLLLMIIISIKKHGTELDMAMNDITILIYHDKAKKIYRIAKLC